MWACKLQIKENLIKIDKLTVLQEKNASWKAFCNIQANKVIFWAQEFLRWKNLRKRNSEVTWNRTRWIKKRRRRGRLNQNRSSPGSTTGAPLTTSPLSVILSPIFVMIICNLAPTNKIICKIHIKYNNKLFMYLHQERKYRQENRQHKQNE